MAFSNITKIILWVVAGISLLVMLFFYISPKTLDYDALELKVTDALTPLVMTPIAPLPVVDTTEGSVEAEGMAVAEDEGDAITTVEVYDTSEIKLGKVLSGWEYMVWFRTDIALVWAYILVLITLIASIVFPLIAVISNPKALVRLLLVLAGAAVLVIISYLLSSDTTIDIIGYSGTGNSDPGTLKMIDTVLFVTYMLFGLALGSILYAVISRAFK